MPVLTPEERRDVRDAMIQYGRRLVPGLDIAAQGTKAEIETGIEEMDAELELHATAIGQSMSAPMNTTPISYRALQLAMITLERAGLLDNLERSV